MTTISEKFDRTLRGPMADGLVDRTVGDSLFYVSLKDGTSMGFQPKDVLVKSHNHVKRYGGQTFRELGLINGARVQIVGLGDPETPDRVVIDIDQKSGFFRRLRSGL